MKGYLGIDNGTQGLSVVFCGEEKMEVIATGESSYGMVPGLEEGCYEQSTEDWDAALCDAMQQVSAKVGKQMEVLAIGISGQMHGEVLADENGEALGPVRLWCDARNGEEGEELTELFQTKVPKRSTCSRFLWTQRNRSERARATRHITTPAGWTSYRLTGEWTLGIGDASGMFPVDQDTLDYDERLLKMYDDLSSKTAAKAAVVSLRALLPRICKAGEDAGGLNEIGARLLGLPTGIPVAPAEGDQPAAMAGSLIADAGQISMSFGTSVVANSVGDRAFQGVSRAVDQFCAADGKPINMIWIRNGTTFMNTIVKMYGGIGIGGGGGGGGGGGSGTDEEDRVSDAFAIVMPRLVDAAPDCGGLIALPFMDDEPGVNVAKGGTAMILGWSPTNATAGNVAKAALLATIFNLKLGSGVLDRQGYPRTEIILTGGLVKTPECGQIVADVFNTPVTLLASGDEGSAWGGAILGKYRHECMQRAGSGERSWADFVESVKVHGGKQFHPNKEAVPSYQRVFKRYQKVLALNPSLLQAL